MERKIDGLMFALGGTAYGLIEILWRGYTHWSMFLLGGLCFLLMEKLQSHMAEQPVWKTAVFSALLITTLEFATGCIVNLLLGWQVWDYSGLAGNIMGQVCPIFTFAWFCISLLFLGLVRMLS